MGFFLDNQLHCSEQSCSGSKFQAQERHCILIKQQITTRHLQVSKIFTEELGQILYFKTTHITDKYRLISYIRIKMAVRSR